MSSAEINSQDKDGEVKSKSSSKHPSVSSPLSSQRDIMDMTDDNNDVMMQLIPEENECDSTHLLAKNTESFRCLAQIMLSSSSLMKNRLFLFPPLEDPGINEAFNFIEPDPVYDDIGIEKYINICKELEIVPISRIVNSLGGETLNLKYYGLTPKQMKALTETLKGNSHVEQLILQDNWINPEVTTMLSSMIEENSTLRVLDLKECRIGEKGAENLREALSSSQFLTELDLSFNSLGDKGLLQLQQGLYETPSLKVLNISHNNLTEDSAEVLEKIFTENRTIQELDLSWNGFSTGPGNKKLFNGLKQNDCITVLKLAWNGIGTKPAMAPIMRYMKQSEHLIYLDLSSNRLIGPSLRLARAGILKNHSLETVKMGNNIYPPEEAYFLASVLTAKAKDPLNYLDMDNMYCKRDILPLLTRIKNMGKTIKIGGILSNYIIKGPNINKLLFERCKYLLMKPKKKKAKKDFGHFILNLPDGNVTRQEFDGLLKKQKIKKLDKDLIDEVTNRFLAKKKKIDCKEMTKTYMEFYPDTCLPPPKAKKKKKGKKGKGQKKGKIDEQTEEKEIKVHDLEIAGQEGENIITEKLDQQLTETENAPQGLDQGLENELNQNLEIPKVVDDESSVRNLEEQNNNLEPPNELGNGEKTENPEDQQTFDFPMETDENITEPLNNS